MRRRYRAFGEVLESDVPLPGLHEVAAEVPPTCFLSVESGPPADDGGVEVGAEDIAYGAHVRLLRLTPSRFRLIYSDTGVFDVSAAGRRIRWWPRAGCDQQIAAMDILGRVFATLLHADGTITLHASAVAIGASAIGFMAPKHYGKSTLAAALTYAGARLVADDALAVLRGAPVRCAPGVPSVRLRQGSAAHFPRTQHTAAHDLAGWRVIDTLSPEQVALEPVPLAALYELAPADSDALPVARRVPMGGVDALLTLTRYAKMGALLGDREGHDHVSRVVDVLGVVPVYTLAYVRDLQRLDEVVRTVVSWHGVGCEPSAGLAPVPITPDPV